MKKKLWLVFNIAISAVFVWLALRGIDFTELSHSFKGIVFSYAIIGLLLNLFSCWLRASRLHYMTLPIQHVTVKNYFASVMIGFMVNNVLPFRLGELMRGYALKKSDGMSFSASMGIIVVERIIDVISLLIIFGALTFFYPFPEWVKNGGILVTVIAIAVTVILGLMISRTETTLRIFNNLVGVFSKKLAISSHHFLSSFLTGVRFLHDFKNYAWITLITFLIWATFTVSTLMMFYCMNLQADGLGTFEAGVFMVFTCFAIMIPAAPGYVGTFHEIAKQSLLLFGVDKEKALGFAIIIHALNYISITGIGFIYFLRSNLKLKQALSGTGDEETTRLEKTSVTI
ncbi:flippase-like domain-containing protein [bacterium]|nr:flippase-like domain-containing protein [bacterium]